MRMVMCVIMVLICAPVVWGGQGISWFLGGTEYDAYYMSAAGDVVGWRFTVSVQLEISDLGVWNNDQTGGIESPHQVGIWDGSHTLVASVTVDGTGTVVGDWIYASITPVIIMTGQTYTIGALYVANDDDYYISMASSLSYPGVLAWIEAVYPLAGELGFVYPESSSPKIGRFGPNFLFEETSLEQTTWGAIKASL